MGSEGNWKSWTTTNGSPWSGPSWEIDTFEIVELNQSNHRLYRIEKPSEIIRSIFPFLSDLADTAMIYRYTVVDTEGIKTISSHKEPMEPVFYFTFKKDVGLSSISMSDGCKCIAWYSTPHSLRSATITSVANPSKELLLQNYLLYQNYTNQSSDLYSKYEWKIVQG